MGLTTQSMVMATRMRMAKKHLGLDWQNDNFVHFFVVVARLQGELPNFKQVLWRTRTQDNDPLFLLLKFDTVF